MILKVGVGIAALWLLFGRKRKAFAGSTTTTTVLADTDVVTWSVPLGKNVEQPRKDGQEIGTIRVTGTHAASREWIEDLQAGRDRTRLETAVGAGETTEAFILVNDAVAAECGQDEYDAWIKRIEGGGDAAPLVTQSVTARERMEFSAALLRPPYPVGSKEYYAFLEDAAAFYGVGENRRAEAPYLWRNLEKGALPWVIKRFHSSWSVDSAEGVVELDDRGVEVRAYQWRIGSKGYFDNSYNSHLQQGGDLFLTPLNKAFNSIGVSVIKAYFGDTGDLTANVNAITDANGVQLPLGTLEKYKACRDAGKGDGQCSLEATGVAGFSLEQQFKANVSARV